MGIAIPQVITSDRASGAQVIDGSVLIDGHFTGSYPGKVLNRTPSSAGNNRTWTLSYWFKKVDNGSGQEQMFVAGTGPAVRTQLYLNDHTLRAYHTESPEGTNSFILQSYLSPAPRYRDFGPGWYHMCWVSDLPNGTFKCYVNNVLDIDGSVNSSYITQVNLAHKHTIGNHSFSDYNNPFTGRLSQMYMIDGQALGPENFGFTDPLTNTWRPKKYTGTFSSSAVAGTGTLTNYDNNTQFPTYSNQGGGSSTIANVLKAFDGDNSTYADMTYLNGQYSRLTFENPITNVTNITVGYDGEGDPGYNGANHQTSVSFNGSRQSIQLYNGSAITLNNLDFISQPGNGVCRLYDVTITTTTQSATELTLSGASPATGVNSFYLPFDGNSPIGQDQSGNGNDWTPVNFGGSVSLDNPQVSGARPILNTLPGGTQATVGVFGSRENIGYAVTVAPKTGGGNAYYIDGVERQTLTGLIRGATYTFDQSDSSNDNHPLRLSITDDGTHTGGGAQYTNGNVQGGTPGTAGAATTITIPYNAPNTLYYYCGNHSGMGNNITGITTNEKLADQYASHCTLALPLVGGDDDVCASIACTARNKTATNSSVNASTKQSNFYSGSHHWSAASDTLQYAEQGDELVFGTGDFTIECWVYDDNGHNGGGSGRCYIFDNRIGGSVVGDPPTMVGHVDSHNEFTFYDGDSEITHSVPSTVGKWWHYAVTREGTTTRMFIDGILRGSSTSSTNFTNNGIGVGRATDGGYGWSGYIQDFRVYKGIAKYTSDFVIPATSPDVLPDTPSGVSGSSKLTKITDGAVSFDGSGDSLSLTGSSDVQFGTGIFTAECFVYADGYPGSGVYGIFDTGTAVNGNRFSMVLYPSGLISIDNNTNLLQSSSAMRSNAWNHVAFVREGTGSNEAKLYINGVLSNQATISTDFNNDDLLIGKTIDNYSWKGQISNVRVIKGTALYTSNFTPPSAPLTSVTNTKLLCCQSNTLAGSATVAPTISGLNDGRVWSSGSTTGTVYASDNDWNNVFNGVAGNDKAIAADDATYEITLPGGGISGVTKVEIYGQQQSGAANATITLSSAGEQSVAQGTSLGYTTFYTGSSDTLTKLKVASTSSNRSSINAVRINDTTILTDPLANSVGASPDAAATNFNPFNTDINTVRGQETGYATLNPLHRNPNGNTTSNGNLTQSTSAGNGHYRANFAIGASSGKFYFEYEPTGGAVSGMVGLCEQGHAGSNNLNGAKAYSYYGVTGYKQGSPSAVDSAYGATYTFGDVVGVAFDSDNNTLEFFKNGVSQGVAFTSFPNYPYYPAFSAGSSSNTVTYNVNFGQKPFKFPPPDGFQPLNLANTRPETVISRPDHYVGVTTYTGDSNPIPLKTGFRPDLVWIKGRTSSTTTVVFDSVRGLANYLQTSETDQSYSGGITQTFVDGYLVPTGTASNNGSPNTYVTWTWKAGGNKNTFNVDDVGYANASDVNMGVGDLTSNFYNTSQTWSSNIVTTGNSGNWHGSFPPANAFNGNNSNYAHGNADGAASATVTLTFNPAIPCKHNVTFLGGFTNTSAGTGTISINGGSTQAVTQCAAVDPAATDVTVVPFTGNVSTIVINKTSSGAQGLILFGFKIDEALLIDSGTDISGFTQYPSIAPSGCSVGTKQGFSIIKYTGNGSAATIPHGLSQTPTFIIKKFVGGTSNWDVWTPFLSANKRMTLNTTDAESATTSYQSVNTSTFDVHAGNNDDTVEMIAYLWHDVPGLQKFGQYTGNSNADGVYVELGFKPAILLIKNDNSTGDWIIWDNKRNPTNPVNKQIWPYTTSGTYGTYDQVASNYPLDFLSNGFKMRTTDADMNDSGRTYIYAAWAEAPSVNLFGGGANAR